MIKQLFGNLIPTITFENMPAKVKSINFRMNDGEIVVLLEDGRHVAMNVSVQNVRLIEGA